MRVSELAQQIKPYVVGWVSEIQRSGGNGGSAPSPHSLSSIHHSGTLSSGQAPQFLLLDGSRPMTGALEINPSIVEAPIIIGANGQDQLVTGLNADLLDGNHASAFALASHTQSLSTITAPTGDVAWNMVNNHFQLTWAAPVSGGGVDGAFEIEAIGAFSGDLVHIHQHTGNPGAGTDLVHIEATDSDVTPLRIVGANTYSIVADKAILGRTLVSNVATGTAPLTVSSTTKVTSLNVDQVDGYDFDQDLRTTATPSFTGLTVSGASVTFSALGTAYGSDVYYPILHIIDTNVVRKSHAQTVYASRANTAFGASSPSSMFYGISIRNASFSNVGSFIRFGAVGAGVNQSETWMGVEYNNNYSGQWKLYVPKVGNVASTAVDSVLALTVKANAGNTYSEITINGKLSTDLLDGAYLGAIYGYSVAYHPGTYNVLMGATKRYTVTYDANWPLAGAQGERPFDHLYAWGIAGTAGVNNQIEIDLLTTFTLEGKFVITFSGGTTPPTDITIERFAGSTWYADSVTTGNTSTVLNVTLNLRSSTSKLRFTFYHATQAPSVSEIEFMHARLYGITYTNLVPSASVHTVTLWHPLLNINSLGNNTAFQFNPATGAAIFNYGYASTGDFSVRGDNDASLLYVDASSDAVGIGTNAPTTGTKFHVKNEVTADPGGSSLIGTQSWAGVNIVGAISKTVIGLYAYAYNYLNVTSNTGSLIGLQAYSRNISHGSVAVVMGGQFYADLYYSDSTSTYAYGVYTGLIGAGTTTYGYGLFVAAPTMKASTIYYGLYIGKNITITPALQYGLVIEDVNMGSVNIALQTGVGKVSFGDNLEFRQASSISTTAGNLTLTPTGDLILNPTGTDVLPGAAFTVNIGSISNKYLTLHAAELWVDTLVASATMATIGGRIIVASTSMLTSDMLSASTSMVIEHNAFVVNDVLMMEKNGQIEWFLVTAGPTGVGPFTYTVTRHYEDVGAGIAHDWYKGDAVVSLGNSSTFVGGFIDLYSQTGVYAGNGPTIVGNARTGAAYNAVANRWAIGNLDGLYGYGTSVYGFAAGDYSTTWISAEATNGFRVSNGSTVLGEWDTLGVIHIGDQVGEHVSITGSGMTFYDANANDRVVIDISGVIVGDQTDLEYLKVTSSAVELYGNNVKLLEVTSSSVGVYDTGAVERLNLTTAGVRVGKSDDDRVVIADSGISIYTGASTLVATYGATITLGDSTGGEYITISSSGVSLYSAAVERIGLTGAGVLTIKNGAGSAVFTFDASTGAEFTLPLTIGSAGGIYQGTGTFATPTTGLKIWNDTGIGRLATYNTGTLQVYFDTSGALNAGAGAVKLDADGIQFNAGDFDISRIKWYSSGSKTGAISSYIGSTYGLLGLYSYGVSGYSTGRIDLVADAFGSAALTLIRMDALAAAPYTTITMYAPSGWIDLTASATDAYGVRVTASSLLVERGLYIGNSAGTPYDNDIVADGGIWIGRSGQNPDVGEIGYAGALTVYRSTPAAEFDGLVSVKLTTPWTKTLSAQSDVSTSTLLDISTFTNCPYATTTWIKGYIIQIITNDSATWGTNGLYFAVGPNSTYWYALASRPKGGDVQDEAHGVVFSDDGDLRYQINASGTGTMDVNIFIWGILI